MATRNVDVDDGVTVGGQECGRESGLTHMYVPSTKLH